MGGKSSIAYILLIILVLESCFERTVCSTVTYDHRALVIDGKRRVLQSGSIHYPRSTPEVVLFQYNLVSKCKHSLLHSVLTWSVVVGVSFRFGRNWLWNPRKVDWMWSKLMFSGIIMSLWKDRYKHYSDTESKFANWNSYFHCLSVVLMFYWILCSIILKAGLT